MIKERELACKPRQYGHGRVNIVGVKFGEAITSKGDSEGDSERAEWRWLWLEGRGEIVKSFQDLITC